MPALTHIISPFTALHGSEWDIAQRVTIETMRQAHKNTHPSTRVELLAAVFCDDLAAVPEGFTETAPLTRSIMDVKEFRLPKKLPLLKDVLERGVAATDAEYMIYTNADIALQPHFYDAVTRFIGQGYDAFVINRRTIAPRYRDLHDLPAMQRENGKPHPGFDCFVFRRDAFPRFILGDVCLGMSHVDLPLIASLIATSRTFGIFRDEHLTFHIGDSRTWRARKFREYSAHNHREACQAVRALLHGRSLGFPAEILLRMNFPHNGIIVRALLQAFNQASR